MFRRPIRELALLLAVVAMAIGWGIDHRAQAYKIDCYNIVFDAMLTPSETFSEGASEDEKARAMAEVWPDGFPTKYMIID